MNLNFEQTHPLYSEMEKRWLMARDFFLGGKRVLAPNHKTGVYYDATYGGLGENVDVDETAPSVSWRLQDSFSYLWRHQSESSPEYYNRCSRAIHIPIFSPTLNVFAAGILRTPPKRQDGRGDFWETYHANCDMSGTTYEALIREALTQALSVGRIHALTDMNGPLDISLVSAQQQRALDIRAYTYLLHPLDIVDWELDEFGRFLWAVVREDERSMREPGEERPESKFQYRVWRRDRWELWRKQNGTWMQVSSVPHAVGEVPIATLYTAHQRTMDCESPLSDILDVDVRVYNKLSELDVLERYCGFPLFTVPVEPGTQLGAFDIGPGRAIQYPAGTGSPQYVSPDPGHARDAWVRIMGYFDAARRSAGISRGIAEESKEARSAAAIGAESEEKRNQMAWWASKVEEFDASILRHVAKWHNADAEAIPVASYARNFNLRAIEQQINDLLQLAATQVLSAIAKGELAKPIVETIMREHGASAETIAVVLEDIDRHSQELETKQQTEDPSGGGGFRVKKLTGGRAVRVFESSEEAHAYINKTGRADLTVDAGEGLDSPSE